MEKFLPWWIAAALMISVGVYFLLTVGTTLLLPKEWDAVKVGMAQEEVRNIFPELITEYNTSPALEDSHVTSLRLGLRAWAICVNYEDGRVRFVEKSCVDPHHSWPWSFQAYLRDYL